ncbi:ArsR/SmtB family transcription factor [Amycolatopsis sp. NPDC059090]|uniref:ArsR/SmtB family transcription factor n=1 Tax=unclassified Amycolatopsis TaxID=2618356 RepID=UPI0036704F32
MLRLRCTPEDLLHVSIAEHPAPLGELTLAMQMLQRRDPDPAFVPWREQIARQLPAESRRLLQLVSPSGAGPMFLDPPSRTVEEGLDRVLSTPRAEVRAELKRVCAIDRPLTSWTKRLAEQDREAWKMLDQALRAGYRRVLAERWHSLRAGFDAETAWRAKILARQGISALFASLRPTLRWNGLTLEADFPRHLDLTLHGHGLVLRPTLLWSGYPLVAYYADRPTTLIYPALTPLPLLAPARAPDPLCALLGTTRAGALRSLITGRTTTGLARELSVSVAAASLHAKTLREAGLIVSRREGKAVCHECTPLGLDLLAAEPPRTGG